MAPDLNGRCGARFGSGLCHTKTYRWIWRPRELQRDTTSQLWPLPLSETSKHFAVAVKEADWHMRAVQIISTCSPIFSRFSHLSSAAAPVPWFLGRCRVPLVCRWQIDGQVRAGRKWKTRTGHARNCSWSHRLILTGNFSRKCGNVWNDFERGKQVDGDIVSAADADADDSGEGRRRVLKVVSSPEDRRWKLTH